MFAGKIVVLENVDASFSDRQGYASLSGRQRNVGVVRDDTAVYIVRCRTRRAHALSSNERGSSDAVQPGECGVSFIP